MTVEPKEWRRALRDACRDGGEDPLGEEARGLLRKAHGILAVRRYRRARMDHYAERNRAWRAKRLLEDEAGQRARERGYAAARRAKVGGPMVYLCVVCRGVRVVGEMMCGPCLSSLSGMSVVASWTMPTVSRAFDEVCLERAEEAVVAPCDADPWWA